MSYKADGLVVGVVENGAEIEELLAALKNHRCRGGFAGPLREVRAVWWDKLRSAQKGDTSALSHTYSGSLTSYVKYVCEI